MHLGHALGTLSLLGSRPALQHRPKGHQVRKTLSGRQGHDGLCALLRRLDLLAVLMDHCRPIQRIRETERVQPRLGTRQRLCHPG